MNQQKPKTQLKMTTKEYGETRCVMRPDWSEEFTENLVEHSVPEHAPASSSRELSSEPRRKSGVGSAQYLNSLPEGWMSFASENHS